MPNKLLRPATKAQNMRPMPAPVDQKKRRQKLPSLPRPESQSPADPAPVDHPRRSYAELLDKCEGIPPDGEGLLLAGIAPPRHGKSTLVTEIIDRRLDAGHLVLIYAPKVPRPGTVDMFPNAIPCNAATMDEVRQRAYQHNRARKFDANVDPDEVIGLGLECARAGIPTIVIIDEGRRLIPKVRSWSGPNAPAAFCEGSSQGLSLVFLTQVPQRMPLEVFDFSQATVIGRQARRTLPYLSDRLCLPPELVALLPRLKVGEFVLLENDQDWDGFVYFTQKA